METTFLCFTFLNKNMMLLIKKVLTPVSLVMLLAGCTVMPGSHISTFDKNDGTLESEQDFDIADHVTVYPLTAERVRQSRAPAIPSKSNPELDAELAKYKYYVGYGDIINVTIWDHPELTIPAGSYRSSEESGNWVHADGKIFYPYIGMVNVNGKTVTEIRADIAKRLEQYIESPQVDVNIAAFRSQKAYVTGEVKDAGQQPITNVPLTVLDAINHAGGLGEDADWRHVTLTRNGVKKELSLYALMQRGDLTQNTLLQGGDIIHVPRNDGQKVFVLGEVNDPQLLKIDRAGMTLTEALTSVGGINELNADATGIFVIRNKNIEAGTAKGVAPSTIQQAAVAPSSVAPSPVDVTATTSNEKTEPEIIADIYQLNIQDAAALVIGTEFELQPYDIVYVTTTPLGRWNRVVYQLLPTIGAVNSVVDSRDILMTDR